MRRSTLRAAGFRFYYDPFSDPIWVMRWKRNIQRHYLGPAAEEGERDGL